MYTRCLACNKVLSSYESSRKYSQSNEEIGLCNKCFVGVDEHIDFLHNVKLGHVDDFDYVDRDEDDSGEFR